MAALPASKKLTRLAVCALQGLNIAPALIAYAPVRTVVNPVGPLNIADVLVSDTLPALP